MNLTLARRHEDAATYPQGANRAAHIKIAIRDVSRSSPNVRHSFAMASNMPRGNTGRASQALVHFSLHPSTLDGIAKTAVINQGVLPAWRADLRIGTTLRGPTKFEFASTSKIDPCRSSSARSTIPTAPDLDAITASRFPAAQSLAPPLLRADNALPSDSRQS